MCWFGWQTCRRRCRRTQEDLRVFLRMCVCVCACIVWSLLSPSLLSLILWIYMFLFLLFLVLIDLVLVFVPVLVAVPVGVVEVVSASRKPPQASGRDVEERLALGIERPWFETSLPVYSPSGKHIPPYFDSGRVAQSYNMAAYSTFGAARDAEVVWSDKVGCGVDWKAASLLCTMPADKPDQPTDELSCS